MRLRRLVPLTDAPPGPGADSAPGLVLDARGQLCPLPVITLARRITEVPVGGLVRVVADDPAARTDVPAWCRLRGHDFVGAAADADGATAYSVRRLH